MSAVQFIVEGGRRLSGSIRPSGNKNAALPIIAAALLTEHPVTLDNVPRIRDVETLVDLLRSIGAAAEWTSRNALRIHAESLTASALDPELCARIRASILLAAPLLARCGTVTLPPPGGDVIGRRRVDTHFLALEQLGATWSLDDGFVLRAERLRGADVFLDEPSVTATENAITAAVAAEGTTVLRNAASEPHVQDLCLFLVGLGAQIDGVGTNTLTIQGGRPLTGGSHTIGPDHIEVGSFIGLAAVTDSELRIEQAGVEHLRSVLMGFDRIGVECRVDGQDLVVAGAQPKRIRDDLGGHVPKLEDQPWPAFPADLMSIAIVTATQCSGIVLFHEKMFESRMFFVDKLITMGARIVLCDPHRAIVAGPSALRAARVESPDIRAGMAMLLAACCARGTSTINNVGQIERGYERIDQRLNALGASIERVEDRRNHGRLMLPREAIDDFLPFGIQAFTTTRAAGSFNTLTSEPVAAVMGRWYALRNELLAVAPRFATARQVHGAAVAEHDPGWRGWLRVDSADGHFAGARGTAMAVTVADCVPIFLGHRSGAAALLHSGWRGTAAAILERGIAAFGRHGMPAAELRIHLGPAICGRCYEVSPDVYGQLTGRLPDRPTPIDLRALLAERARGAGVRDIATSSACTRCDNERFFSHRAGDEGRQLGVLVAPA